MSDDPLGDENRASPCFFNEIEGECNNIILKQFIDTFETLPELWDVTNPNYKDLCKRNEALDRLLTIQKLWKSDASRDDVRKKINCLRSNFRKELRKIETSKRSGIGRNKVYKPKSSTFKALRFLLKTNNIGNNFVKKEINNSNSAENSSTTSECFSYLKPADKQPPRRQKRKNLTTERPESPEKGCELHFQTQNQDQISAVVDPLALVWTQKLKTLNGTQRILAEKAINDILFEAQFNNLHRASSPYSKNSPSSGSSSN